MIKNAIREMPKLVRANLTIGGNTMFDYAGFIKAVLEQDGTEIHSYFADDAVINWHCTNECFTVDEYIIANCEYPGKWDGEIETVQPDRQSLCCYYQGLSQGSFCFLPLCIVHPVSQRENSNTG